MEKDILAEREEYDRESRKILVGNVGRNAIVCFGDETCRGPISVDGGVLCVGDCRIDPEKIISFMKFTA